MHSLRRQLVTLLAVWLVAFPLPPIARHVDYEPFQRTAIAQAVNGIITEETIRAANISVWQSIFAEQMDENVAMLWLDREPTAADQYVTGTTHQQMLFGFAFSQARYTEVDPSSGNRIESCAGVISTPIAARAVLAFVVSGNHPVSGERRTRVFIVDTLPSDMEVFLPGPTASLVSGPQFDDPLEEFLRQAQQESPANIACSSLCHADKRYSMPWRILCTRLPRMPPMTPCMTRSMTRWTICVMMLRMLVLISIWPLQASALHS